MSAEVVVQRAATFDHVPDDAQFALWASSVTGKFDAQGEMTLRIIGEQEMQTLNREYRQQDKVTNVLSFEVDEDTRNLHGLLGDIAICAPVVSREAAEQEKQTEAHWAHMVIHGVLHLLGFDHVDDDQANEMEAYEIQLLEGCGYDNPYSVHSMSTQGNN